MTLQTSALTCKPETGKRTELNVPFQKKLTKTSLVSIEDIRCVCPDATHMITRSVGRDLRKMAQKTIDDMHPHKKFALQRFKENLTRLGTKKPFFQFTTVSIGGTDKAGKIGAVSPSGICALTVMLVEESSFCLSAQLRLALILTQHPGDNTCSAVL